jgi:hypothetical protein
MYGNVKKRKDEVEHYRTKGYINSPPLDTGNFVIKYDGMIKVAIDISFGFFVLALLINIGNVFFGWGFGSGSGIFTLIGFGFLFLLTGYAFLGTTVWKITVRGNEIIYRNYFGISKTYYYSQLEKIIITKKEKIMVYQDGKKIMTIDNNLDGGIYFRFWANKYNVQIENL